MKVLMLIALMAAPGFAGYKALLDTDGNTRTDFILRTDDGANIPVDPANRDYQAFLEWQRLGNTIAPGDVVPVDATRRAAKKQALLDVKNASLTQAQRFRALLILLDLDQ